MMDQLKIMCYDILEFLFKHFYVKRGIFEIRMALKTLIITKSLSIQANKKGTYAGSQK